MSRKERVIDRTFPWIWMTSNENRRGLKGIDYKNFHETEKRVEKIMGGSAEFLLEAKLVADINVGKPQLYIVRNIGMFIPNLD